MTPAQRRVHLGAWCAAALFIAIALSWSLLLRDRSAVVRGPADTAGAHP